MGFAQQQHAQAALANAAAHRQGQGAVQQHLMERQLRTLRAACFLKLTAQRLGVYADAHAGKFQRTAQRLVPEENIAVQRPVIVVRGTAVVGFAALQLASDLHDADGAMLLGKSILALFGGKVGVPIFQFLGGDKGHVAAQVDVFQFGELPSQLIRGRTDGVHDIPHSVLQKVQRALVSGDDLFPVPLVHIDAVQVVQFFIAADGVHVGDKALAGAEAILVQGIALPFCQAVNDLGLLVQAGNIERDRAFHTV